MTVKIPTKWSNNPLLDDNVVLYSDPAVTYSSPLVSYSSPNLGLAESGKEAIAWQKQNKTPSVWNKTPNKRPITWNEG